jgi:hypothetical protein
MTTNFFSNVTYLPKQRMVREFLRTFLPPNQVGDWDTKPEVCLSGEECNNHLHIHRESGRPRNLMVLLHADPNSYSR